MNGAHRLLHKIVDGLGAEGEPLFIIFCRCRLAGVHACHAHIVGEPDIAVAYILLKLALCLWREVGTQVVVAAAVEEDAIDIIFAEVTKELKQVDLHVIVAGVKKLRAVKLGV